MTQLKTYGQYKHDIFTKLDFPFQNGKSLLDVGCGDGSDAIIFQEVYGLKVSAIDVYTHDAISTIPGLEFKQAGIYDIPYGDDSFDYIFLHDVLHHIDEETQSRDKHIAGLQELLRVIKPGGKIIIVEGNRYNPLFYPHMVKTLHHEHFTQKYFISIMNEAYQGHQVSFKFFESHFYPQAFLGIWKIYEAIMERIVPKAFLAYNVVIITK